MSLANTDGRPEQFTTLKMARNLLILSVLLLALFVIPVRSQSPSTHYTDNVLATCERICSTGEDCSISKDCSTITNAESTVRNWMRFNPDCIGRTPAGSVFNASGGPNPYRMLGIKFPSGLISCADRNTTAGSALQDAYVPDLDAITSVFQSAIEIWGIDKFPRTCETTATIIRAKYQIAYDWLMDPQVRCWEKLFWQSQGKSPGDPHVTVWGGQKYDKLRWQTLRSIETVQEFEVWIATLYSLYFTDIEAIEIERDIKTEMSWKSTFIESCVFSHMVNKESQKAHAECGVPGHEGRSQMQQGVLCVNILDNVAYSSIDPAYASSDHFFRSHT